MGFREGAYCKLWKVTDDGKRVSGQISISRKNKDTGEYVTDFQGYVNFYGKAAEHVKELAEGDRFQIKGCDVSRVYDKEAKREYINFRVFEIEKVADHGGGQSKQQTSEPAQKAKKSDDNMSVAELEARLAEAKLRESGKSVIQVDEDDDLPF